MQYKHVTAMKLLLLGSSLATLAALAAAAYRDNFGGEWRDTQRRYRAALIANATGERAGRTAEGYVIEHKQIFLEGLRAVDRCVSCHVGVENPAMADATQPLRAHPGDALQHHPVEKFGCTVCHQGQGRATTREAAHGWRDEGGIAPHSQDPLLRGDAVFTSCGRCHYEIDIYGGQADLFAGSAGAGAGQRARPEIDRASLRLDLPGTEVLREGKRLVTESGCLGCHKYRGGGGELGADLTHIGDKTRHDFDFTQVKGEHTVERWLYEHFLAPSEISPGSVMPSFGFTEQQARSLTLFMMSLHRKNVPASHTPRPRPTATTPDRQVSGELLFKMFCAACHGPSGAGDGPAASTLPTPPRNLVREPPRYVSTVDGVATDEDLARTIATGRGIEEMAKDPNFTDKEVRLLVEYVRSVRLGGVLESLKEAFADDDEITPEEIEEIARERVEPGDRLIVPLPSSGFRHDPVTAANLFAENCASCHGPEGHGDGPQELVDSIGRPIQARDLTQGKFRGGSEPAELFKRFRIGLPGTPMPAQETLTDDEIWQLVRFVLGLVRQGAP